MAEREASPLVEREEGREPVQERLTEEQFLALLTSMRARIETLEAEAISSSLSSVKLSSSVARCKPAEPPKFAGKDQDVREWLQAMHDYCTVGGCAPESMVPLATTFLSPRVAQHWRMRATSLPSASEWKTFEAEMIASYGSANPETKAAHKLVRLRQATTVEDYARRFQELVAQIVQMPMSEGDLIRHFMMGLSEEMQIELTKVAKGKSWDDFNELRSTAIQLDTGLRQARAGKLKDRKGKEKADQGSSSSEAPPFRKNKRKFPASSSSKGAQFRSKKVESKPRAKFVGYKLSKEERARLMKENKCFICKEAGHRASECSKKTTQQLN